MKVTATRALVVALSTVVVAGVADIGWASIPNSSTKIISSCYTNTTGALRVIDKQGGATCNAGETLLEWNSRGVNWRGAWSAAASYAVNDAVSIGGYSFIATSANTNSPPPSAAWAVLAAKGSPGLVWKGTWSSATAYKVGDAVLKDGSSYIAVAASTNSAPPSASWNVLAAKGDPTYKSTIVVGPVGTELQNGAALSAVLNSFGGTRPVPSATNPVMIKIEPGVYNVGSISLLRYVTLEGSGPDATVIKGIGSGSGAAGTVGLSGQNTLRDLSIQSTVGQYIWQAAVFLYIDSTGPVNLVNVDIQAGDATSGAAAVKVSPGSTSAVTIRDSKLSVTSTVSTNAAMNGILDTRTVYTDRVENTRISVNGATTTGTVTGIWPPRDRARRSTFATHR